MAVLKVVLLVEKMVAATVEHLDNCLETLLVALTVEKTDVWSVETKGNLMVAPLVVVKVEQLVVVLVAVLVVDLVAVLVVKWVALLADSMVVRMVA